MVALKLVLTLPSLFWGHGVVTHPPTFNDATGITSKTMGGNCAFLWCFGYENYTYIKDGAATIKDVSPLRTMKNCRAELHRYLGDGTDLGCLASVGLPPGQGHDIARTHPWRAPGTAFATSPCGVQGGNPRGCPHGNPLAGGCYSGGWGHGKDNRKLMNQGVVTEWKAGSAQEVKWGNFANHDGGYSYRLCKKPTNPMDLTEECFQKMPLDFVNDSQWIEYVGGKQKGRRFEFLGLTAMGNLTSPPGSQWRRNPIPACNWLSGRGTPCLGFQFPPVDGLGVLSGFGGYGPFPDWQIVDLVQVPKDLPAGDYVLSWRWDVEEFTQVWSSCSHVRITTSDPSPKAELHPAAERNITCVAPSRELCAEDEFACLKSSCPSKLFDTELLDFSGDRCSWHCKPRLGADQHSEDEYRSLFAPPATVACHDSETVASSPSPATLPSPSLPESLSLPTPQSSADKYCCENNQCIPNSQSVACFGVALNTCQHLCKVGPEPPAPPAPPGPPAPPAPPAPPLPACGPVVHHQDITAPNVKSIRIDGEPDVRTQECQAACCLEPQCDSWVVDNGDSKGTSWCWLKKFGTKSSNRHGNLRRSCEGIQQDMPGQDVTSTKTAGSQDEKDAACCTACQANDSCEAWVQATNGDQCWLKKIKSSSNKRNSGIKDINGTARVSFTTLV